MPGINDTIWQAIAVHQSKIASMHMTGLFEADASRADRYQIKAAGILLDYSKNLITDETLNLFSRLIDATSLPHRVQQLIDGERVNVTERRPALHTLLRTRPNRIPQLLTRESEEVSRVLARIEEISTAIRNRKWLGHNGKAIKHVIHIGIGGSYLGPKVVAEALTPYRNNDIECHFVANVDGHHLDHLLKQLNQDETLVIIASKTFTTLETRVNAESTRDWLRRKMDAPGLQRHLIGVTGNTEAAVAFGIAAEHVLPIWDWVGGRYSLWSAVGLPIAIVFGFKVFRALLDGASQMDNHFEDAPWPENLPMMLALLGVWYHNFWNAGSHAVLPYNHWLRLLPAHLQQLDMESNGKSVNRDGEPVSYTTGPIVWGGEGTTGQHAYHQLLHQGTRFVSTDFILPLTPHHKRLEHHNWLVANCFAQSQALMLGQGPKQIPGDGRTKPHRVMPGNRPSNMILMDQLTPETLGALIAMYEHKVFCQAMIWHINPFDQWGVELGKQLGEAVHTRLTGEVHSPAFDPSTEQLIYRYKSKLKI
jgi:glucose-6-phosphate isomerase